MILQDVPLFIVANVVQTVKLTAAQPVPSSAHYNKGIAQKQDGSLYVVDSATSFAYVKGLRCRQDGAIAISTATPLYFLDGVGVTDTGKLCAVAAGAADQFNGGIPQISATNRVRVSNV
jgi:hypothetical protein